jgi:hypothetical protein
MIVEKKAVVGKPGAVVQVHHIDVGQGEATLIIIAKGDKTTTILVDGGKAAKGGMTIQAYLGVLKIKSIDIVVCTHYDADHIEGLTYLLMKTNLLDKASFYDHGKPFFEDDKILKYSGFVAKKVGDKASRWPTKELTWRVDNRGASVGELLGKNLLKDFDVGGVTLICVAINGFVLGKDKPFANGDGAAFENSLSIGLVLRVGDFCYFTGGDLDDYVESELIPCFKNSTGNHLCCFKAGHHGTNEGAITILNKLSPSAAFISCGKMDRYDHPGSDLMGRMESLIKHNYYLTNCNFPRPQVAQSGTRQDGKARVGGGPNHLGSILLTVAEDDSSGANHCFSVSYWDPERNRIQTMHHLCGQPAAVPIPGDAGPVAGDQLHVAQCPHGAGSLINAASTSAILEAIKSGGKLVADKDCRANREKNSVARPAPDAKQEELKIEMSKQKEKAKAEKQAKRKFWIMDLDEEEEAEEIAETKEVLPVSKRLKKPPINPILDSDGKAGSGSSKPVEEKKEPKEPKEEM